LVRQRGGILAEGECRFSYAYRTGTARADARVVVRYHLALDARERINPGGRAKSISLAWCLPNDSIVSLLTESVLMISPYNILILYVF
jgi:hypothetical protein